MNVSFDESFNGCQRITVDEFCNSVNYFVYCDYDPITNRAEKFLAQTSATYYDVPAPHPMILVRVIRKLLDTLINLGCREVSFTSATPFTSFHRQLIKEYGWRVLDEKESEEDEIHIWAIKPEPEAAK